MKTGHVNAVTGEQTMNNHEEEYTEEQVQQAMQPPSVDQLVIALLYELNNLRVEVVNLNRSVQGLQATLLEDEE